MKVEGGYIVQSLAAYGSSGKGCLSIWLAYTLLEISVRSKMLKHYWLYIAHAETGSCKA